MKKLTLLQRSLFIVVFFSIQSNQASEKENVKRSMRSPIAQIDEKNRVKDPQVTPSNQNFEKQETGAFAKFEEPCQTPVQQEVLLADLEKKNQELQKKVQELKAQNKLKKRTYESALHRNNAAMRARDSQYATFHDISKKIHYMMINNSRKLLTQLDEALAQCTRLQQHNQLLQQENQLLRQNKTRKPNEYDNQAAWLPSFSSFTGEDEHSSKKQRTSFNQQDSLDSYFLTSENEHA